MYLQAYTSYIQTYPHFSVWLPLLHLTLMWIPFPNTKFPRWGAWLIPANHWQCLEHRLPKPLTSNCLAGRASKYLIELCYSVNDIPARRNLRSSSQVQLLVPRYRKERSGRRDSSVSSPQLWNLLPADIRLLHNEHQLFRKRLKTHYMQQSMLRHWGSMSTVWSLLLLILLYITPRFDGHPIGGVLLIHVIYQYW